MLSLRELRRVAAILDSTFRGYRVERWVQPDATSLAMSVYGHDPGRDSEWSEGGKRVLWFSCAVTTAGGVKCWEGTGQAQLENTNQVMPRDVSGLTSGVASVSTGFRHTCVVTTGGGVKCWGVNWSGRLGDGTRRERTIPVDVVGLTSGIAAVSAGGSGCRAGGNST